MTVIEVGDDHVLRLVRKALIAADARGVVPTPLDQIAATIGIVDILDVAELNATVARRALRTFRRIRGAVIFAEKVILVDLHGTAKSQRWIEAHELTHQVLPWHVENSYLDDDHTLTPEAHDEQEQDANTGAGHMLFQDDVFFDRALSYRHGVAVPVHLAPEFATSITATMRYYVRHHLQPIALIAATRHVVNGYSRVLYAEASQPYVTRYGDPRSLLSAAGLPVNSYALPAELAAAVRITRQHPGHPTAALELVGNDVNGDQTAFEVEVLHNGYTTFVVVQPRRWIRLGRRLRISA